MSMQINTGIPEQDRKQIADGLGHFLADTYALYLKTHKFHWNVTGPMFQTLHTMFEVQYNDLWISVDLIAERIRALGFPAPGSYSEFSQLASIKESVGPVKAHAMIRELVDGHETAVRTARKIHPIAEKGGDEATLDVLNARIQVHEKTAWMLRSLLED